MQLYSCSQKKNYHHCSSLPMNLSLLNYTEALPCKGLHTCKGMISGDGIQSGQLEHISVFYHL